jgi:hypothetical protein
VVCWKGKELYKTVELLPRPLIRPRSPSRSAGGREVLERHPRLFQRTSTFQAVTAAQGSVAAS